MPSTRLNSVATYDARMFEWVIEAAAGSADAAAVQLSHDGLALTMEHLSPHATAADDAPHISAATQQLSGGVASLVAGHLVAFGADGKLQHFSSVGYVVVASTVLAVFMAWNVNRGVQLRALA